MVRTADGVDHGGHQIEDCIEAVVERYDDGYVLCPLNWQGVTCEECMKVFEEQISREESKVWQER